jgi:ankyrin repeat protein
MRNVSSAPAGSFDGPYSQLQVLRKIAVFMHSGFMGLNNRLDGLTDRFEELQLSLNAHFSKSVVGRERLLEWLNAVFTDEEYEGALASRLNGTCDWILQQSQFRAWATADSVSDTRRILWVHGPPGFGKTVLCARVVQHLQNSQSAPVASFFCVSEANRQPLDIIRSWVAQMVNKNQDALEAASEVYRGKEARAATTSDVWQLLRNISLRIPNCIFVVDGFDECIKVDKALQINAPVVGTDFLRQLVDTIKQTGSRILFVSRDDADIRSQFTASSPSSEPFYEYQITSRDTRDDINSFSRSVVDRKLANKQSALREELAEEAARRCDGMFLWIRLLRGRLSPGKNAKQLRETVSEMPAGLEQTYERDLERMMDLSVDERDRAIAILRWTLFAQRPLTVREMTEALVVDVDNGSATYPSHDLPDAWDEPYINDQIRRLCGSLIELRGQEQDSAEIWTVHFVHFSVREYLSRATNISFPRIRVTFPFDAAAENELLARVCLHYLCYDDLTEERHCTKEVRQKKIKQYQFLAYAARFWHVHALYGGDCSQILVHLINRLFDPLASRWILWSDIFDSEEESSEKLGESSNDNHPSPLYYASLLGLIKTMEYLQIQGLDLNRRGGKYGSALQAAAVNNHEHAVKFLLKHRADVNIPGGEFGSAIAGAAANGSTKDSAVVVQLLIAAGADLSMADDGGRTALYFAARSGAVRVVELLLEQEVDARSISTSGETALHTASDNGHKTIIKLLLDRGAEVKAATNEGVTPLNLAAWNGHAEVVKFLVEQGADAKGGSNDGWTPLHLAAGNGHTEVVKFLVEQGADAKAGSNDRWTPLHLAARDGHAEVIKFLVEQGANAKAGSNGGGTPLHLAALNGHFEVVKFLVKQGADVKASDKDKWTPLHAAASNKHSEVVKFLVEQGADVKASDNYRKTPLHTAAYNGNIGVVKFLVEQGADVKASNNGGGTPLHVAAVNGHIEVSKFLVEQSADAKASDNHGWTPLHVAADNGHNEVVKFLVEQDADMKASDNRGRTPLHIAAYNGHFEVVKFLVEQGADVKASNNYGRTPLHVVAYNGHFKVVKFLVEQGADVKASDNYGRTPLHQAAGSGHTEVLRLLLDRGAEANVQCRMGQTPLHKAICGDRLEVVQLLFSLSVDPLIVDGYGRTCIDWASLYPQMLNVLTPYHTELHHTDPAETTKILCKSIVILANWLQSSQSEMFFYELGHCLLLLGDMQEACTAFEQQITPNSHKANPMHSAFCDFCGEERISGDRFVCFKCVDIDLCSMCMERYNRGESVRNCEGHNFLKVPGEDWAKLREQEVNTSGETKDQWLERLVRKYEVVEISGLVDVSPQLEAWRASA